MRSLVLGLTTMMLQVSEGHSVFHRRPTYPRGKLAKCNAEGCQWRNFVHELTPATTCRRHPGQTDYVPDGTILHVRCFHDGCLQDSVRVTYWRTMHIAENFQCPVHVVRR